MQSKINALHENQTWTLVPPSSNINPVISKWVFKIKTRANGSIELYKACLVAWDFTQLQGLDYEESLVQLLSRELLD